jgi:hypothetical protein
MQLFCCKKILQLISVAPQSKELKIEWLRMNNVIGYSVVRISYYVLSGHFL